MAQQYRAEGLKDPSRGDPISAEQARLQNELLRRSISAPCMASDSTGTRIVTRSQKSTDSNSFVEITYIDDAVRSFQMKDYGVCIGKLITYDSDENWAVQYPGTVIEDVEDGEVFCGFVDQARAGVPGQRYYARSYGTKTCGTLELPLVMLEGGAPTSAVLAEEHPGCGTLFDVWLGPIWNPTSHEWDLTTCDSATATDKFKAIDLREGVPLPGKYATGIFVARVSLTYGIVLEAMEIDCESPGECGFCTPAV